MLSTCLCTCTCVSMWYSLIEQTKWMNEWMNESCDVNRGCTWWRHWLGAGECLAGNSWQTTQESAARQCVAMATTASVLRWQDEAVPSSVRVACFVTLMSFYAEIADVFARGRHATASYSRCWSVQFPSKTATRFTTNVCTGKVVLVERQNKINRAC